MVSGKDAGGAERYALSVLDGLEAESIHIFREAAAERARPVMFSPGRIPFPLLHIDTSFSLRDAHGQRDPKSQRPEPWNLCNTRVGPGAIAPPAASCCWTPPRSKPSAPA